MYRVTKLTHIRLDGGRSVVLQPGRRGWIDANGDSIDPEAVDAGSINLDATLQRALPPDILAALISDGTIVIQ